MRGSLPAVDSVGATRVQPSCRTEGAVRVVRKREWKGGVGVRPRATCGCVVAEVTVGSKD